MKIVDKLLSKIGTDKVLHFCTGSAISSFTALSILPAIQTCGSSIVVAPLFGTIVSTIIGMIKEKLDTVFDEKDLLATVLGSVPTYIAIGLSALFTSIL